MKYRLFINLVIALAISGSVLSQEPTTSLDTSALQTFAKVEKESEFPGGRDAWGKYLSENLRYPQKAQRKKIQGLVVVQFIVNKDGSLSDIEAISGPLELRNAAVDVIKKSPRWIPAEQSGKIVKSYKKQPIGFRL
jgi:protein TonB